MKSLVFLFRVNCVVFVFISLLFTSCSRSESDGQVASGACDSDICFLVADIDIQLPLPSDSDSDYTLTFLDNSSSSGSLKSRSWEVVDLKDSLANPANIGCGLNDCNYSGASNRQSTGSSITISDIGNLNDPNGTSDHDDFIVVLTVTDSNGLTAKASMTYSSFANVSGFEPKIISGAEVSITLDENLCSVDYSVDIDETRNDPNSDFETIGLGANFDGTYSQTKVASGFPLSLDKPVKNPHNRALLSHFQNFVGRDTEF